MRRAQSRVVGVADYRFVHFEEVRLRVGGSCCRGMWSLFSIPVLFGADGGRSYRRGRVS